jgi:hypothetical protein
MQAVALMGSAHGGVLCHHHFDILNYFIFLPCVLQLKSKETMEDECGVPTAPSHPIYIW